MPISSSAHTAAVPWLLGWSYPELEPSLRKTFEVALHAGSALGLAIGLRRDLSAVLRDRRQLTLIAVASAPAGLAGVGLESRIETRLGTPPTIAAGLLAGALLLAVADRSPQIRRLDAAGAADGVWLGLAQAGALIPGVSRNGVTVAAARLLRFRRGDASVLSRRLSFPVIGGAVVLKGWRAARRPPVGAGPALLAGASASLASTLMTGRWLRAADEKPLLRYAIYRAGMAAGIIIRLRSRPTARWPRPARP